MKPRTPAPAMLTPIVRNVSWPTAYGRSWLAWCGTVVDHSASPGGPDYLVHACTHVHRDSRAAARCAHAAIATITARAKRAAFLGSA